MRQLMKDGTLVEIEAPIGSEEMRETQEIEAINKANGKTTKVMSLEEHRRKYWEARRKKA